MNNDLPNIAIGLVTFRRTEQAVRTVKSTITNLIYPKENIGWYVGDDGSAPEHMQAVLGEIEAGGHKLIGFHSEKLRHPEQEDSYNAGLGWNKVLGLCHQSSDFVLWLEDDWELDEPLDLVPYVKLLQDEQEVGLCTFRILSTGAELFTVGYYGRIYLQYERRTQYAFSGNPYLRHARYTKKYGWFAEDRNPGLMELAQDDMYRLAMEGPRIVRPFAIDQWGAWKHIGQDKTWE